MAGGGEAFDGPELCPVLEYGLRAALKLLRTYYQKHGCRTIRQIVARWDPEGPKVIEAYVNTVCKHTGLSPDQQLPPMKEETKVMWCDIVLAMATMECGLNVKQQEELVPFIARGWAMKGSLTPDPSPSERGGEVKSESCD